MCVQLCVTRKVTFCGLVTSIDWCLVKYLVLKSKISLDLRPSKRCRWRGRKSNLTFLSTCQRIAKQSSANLVPFEETSLAGRPAVVDHGRKQICLQLQPTGRRTMATWHCVGVVRERLPISLTLASEPTFLRIAPERSSVEIGTGKGVGLRIERNFAHNCKNLASAVSRLLRN